ncbi:MAG: hypothetical protein ACOC7Y_01140 [Chloroflexota bacterium]
MKTETSAPILLVAARWQTRALLAAQIGETAGEDVVPAPDVNGALKLIKLAGVDPALLVVDADRHLAREDVERLLEGAPGVPLVLLVSGLRRETFEPLRGRCAAYLVRPVTVGAVARTVSRVLSGRNA